MADENTLDECYETMEKLILDTGKIITEAIYKEKSVEMKGIDWDFVTEYDRTVEDTLVKYLSKKFPSYKFIGEETVARTQCLPELTDDPTWIIDPIDGTTNFVHAFPHLCISVALLIRKQIEIGMIYNPIAGQLFSARRGHGSFLNKKSIKTSNVQDLSQALIGMEPWTAKDKEITAIVYNRMHAVIEKTHGIRTLGTAALSLCYVAMGAIEAYHVEGIYSWDVAAGKLIIEEAGGTIVDTAGGNLDLMEPRVIAGCNRQITNQLVQLFKEADVKALGKNTLIET